MDKYDYYPVNAPPCPIEGTHNFRFARSSLINGSRINTFFCIYCLKTVAVKQEIVT